MTAALRFVPQYAIKRVSSFPHCTTQFATSQGDRTTLTPMTGPGGPGSPLGPGGPGGPGSPFSPGPRSQLIIAPARAIAVTAWKTRIAMPMLGLNLRAHRDKRAIRRAGAAAR